MTERRDHLREILEDQAELGVSDTVDLWPGIRERVSGENRSPRRVRFLPATRAGWAVAMLVVFFLFGSIAYASGLLDALVREYWPGGEKSAALGVQLDQEQTAGDRTVVLERAYADTENVVVGYHKTNPDENMHPQIFRLWDEDGNLFETTTATYVQGFVDASVEIVSFGPLESLEETRSQRFVLEIDEDGTSEADETFVFEFEAPVRPVPEVEVGQEVTHNDLSLTLERVEVSPPRTRFFVCHSDPRLQNNAGWVMRADAGRVGQEPITDVTEGLMGGPVWQMRDVPPPGPAGAEDVPPGVDIPRPDPQAWPLEPDPNTPCAILDFTGPPYNAFEEPGEYYVRVTEVFVGPDEDDLIQGPWEFRFEVPEDLID